MTAVIEAQLNLQDEFLLDVTTLLKRKIAHKQLRFQLFNAFVILLFLIWKKSPAQRNEFH